MTSFRRGGGAGREGGGDPVDGLAVDAGEVGDVLGALEPALDLERGDAEAHQVGQDVEAGEVLRAEEVAAAAEVDLPAVGDEVVGHAAGLGAFAAVGGAAAERLGGEALAGVGDAERAVDEDLELDGGGGDRRAVGRGLLGELGLEFADLGEGVLAGEDDEAGAEIAGEADAGGAGDRHLRRDVDRQVRREGANQSAEADILHDHGVDPGGDEGADVVGGFGDLVGEDEDVEGDVAAHAAPVEEAHELRKVGGGEVVRAHPGVEALKAEVDGVGAVLDGGAHAVPVARGGEDLGPAQHGGRAGGRGGGLVNGCGHRGRLDARSAGVARNGQVRGTDGEAGFRGEEDAKACRDRDRLLRFFAAWRLGRSRPVSAAGPLRGGGTRTRARGSPRSSPRRRGRDRRRRGRY